MRGFFWDQSWLAQTPPTGFMDLFLIFQIFVFYICIYLVIGELRELCAKFWNSLIKIQGEIIGQSWALLTPFNSGPIVHWLSSPIFPCSSSSSSVPHRWHLHLSPPYDVLDHTNHMISVRIWSWQHVSVNKSSLFIAELSPVYCCLVTHMI